MSNEVENSMFEDDGTLACLHLSADRARKRFNCPDELQSNLVGKTFWVIVFFDNVPSKYSQDRYLFQIKFEKDAPDSEARKVWTGSTAIKSVLDALRELNKFPRKVTLRKGKNNDYYFE